MSKQCASATAQSVPARPFIETADSALMRTQAHLENIVVCEVVSKTQACVCAFEKFSSRLLLFSAANLLLTVCVQRWLSQLMMPFSVRP